jgi:hypothetical protein
VGQFVMGSKKSVTRIPDATQNRNGRAPSILHHIS